MTKILYKKTNLKKWAFQQWLLPENCRLFAQRRPTKGGSRAPKDPPLATPLNSHLESVTLENKLNEVGLPAILKPACGTGSVLIQKIHSFDDLLYAIKSSKKHYSSVIGSHAPLCSKFLDLSRYPLALTDRLMILEKYVEGEIIELDG